jgi:hypothetical protein
MIKKALVGFVTAASMILPSVLITASAESIYLSTTCTFNLKAPDGTIPSNSTVIVSVFYTLSSSGYSVNPTWIYVFNATDRNIILTKARWENSTGTTVYRGRVGQIMLPKSEFNWNPPNESKAWIPLNQNPIINIAAETTTRPVKYKNPLLARISAFFNFAYSFVKNPIQQGFQKYRALPLNGETSGCRLSKPNDLI